MSNAIIQQGRFVSDGLRKTLAIRSDVDWMTIYNETATIQNAANRPTNFYWQRGMAAGRGLKVVKLGAVANDPLTNGQVAANAGFTLVNQGSDALVSAGVAFTAISNATAPVVSTADTSLLQVGDVVRLSQPPGAGLDAKSLDGIDWQISAINPNVSFTIAGVLPNVVGAGTAGTWRKVNISSIFYPQTRYIINITTADPLFPIVTTSVDHGYVVGQEVRFHVSQVVMGNAYGMTQIDNLVAPITAVTANTFTVSLDTTGFGAFAFPTNANYPVGGITPAFVGPVGEDTATALNAVPQANILSDATVNTAIIGMTLGAGTAGGVDVGPAGEANDVIYWVAGKSFSVSNN